MIDLAKLIDEYKNLDEEIEKLKKQNEKINLHHLLKEIL